MNPDLTLILCVAAGLLVFRLLFVWSRLRQVRAIRRCHSEYVTDRDKGPQDLEMQTSTLKALLRDSGVTSRHTSSVVEPGGWGLVTTGEASAVDNIASMRKDVVFAIRSTLNDLEGYYCDRVRETFSPLFWVEFVVFLPRHLLSYLGVPGDHLATKILNLTYWFLSVAYLTVGRFLVAYLQQHIQWNPPR